MALKDLLKSTKRPISSPLAQLDRHLLSLNTTETRKEDGMFHPSGLSDCPRQETYRKMGLHLGEPIDSRLRRIFDNGHGLHSRLQDYLRDMGVLEGQWFCRKCENRYWAGPGKVSCPKCKSETRFQKYREVPVEDKELRILGHADGLCHFEGQPPMLLEAKSINSNGWSALTAPYLKHIEQATIYMKKRSINRTLFWYENKNNQEIKEFIVTLDESIWLDIKDRIDDVIRALDMEELPDRICDKVSCKRAIDCEHREVCFSEATFADIKKMVAAK